MAAENPVIEVPLLDKKLDELLLVAGRNQNWLAGALGLTPPAISDWRDKGGIPRGRVEMVCRLLKIDRETLLLPEWPKFKAAVDAIFAFGSQKRWNNLLFGADESAGALLLEPEDDRTARKSLRGVDYHPGNPLHLPPTQEVSVGERIRFALTPEALTSTGFAAVAFVLCVEDRRGWTPLCPKRGHADFTLEGGRYWLPPRNREALYVNEPIGTHRAVAIVLGAKLPQEIQDDFHKFEWASDALAAWIGYGKLRHKIFQRRFNVMAARRGSR